MTQTPAVPRPDHQQTGDAREDTGQQPFDVVELILDDHRFFEDLLRELRNERADRDALRGVLSAVLVAHGEAEESHVYPQLERRDAIEEDEAEHGEEEHRDIYRALLPVLEAEDLVGEDFSQALHELSETLSHHLDEEERDILNPARTEVEDSERSRLGRAWALERGRLLDAGCGSAAQVRSLLGDD